MDRITIFLMHIKLCVGSSRMVYVPGWSHTMNKKEYFGELLEKDFNIGDIVEWSTYNTVEEDWNDNYGIITTIENEIQSGRLISVSNVLPINGIQVEIKFFTASLKLVSHTKNRKD